ncbi:MAG: gliding motility-associated C-terminal domain-containing protein [Bacteroidales bacterium]|nr:gliding motility-associated C-terminal domain-containing protein [Bacteroidales bacterium]
MNGKIRMASLILALVVMGTATVRAQGMDPCPEFRNPTSFWCNNGNTFTFQGWSARVGERCYSSGNTNDTTDGYTIKSTCSSPTSPAITGHANITSTVYNSGTDNFTCTNTNGMWDNNDKRFQIINMEHAGTIGYTVGTGGASTGMPRIPDGYTSSIRLGDLRTTGQAQNNNCNYSASSPNKGSEALFYTLYVTPDNALLQINYAIVARKYDHTAYDAGEFCIRVVKQNDDGTWPNEPIDDSLWYKVSAPHFSGNLPAPWLNGMQGQDYGGYTCSFVYKPWTKVAISLTKYLYSNVRVEMYTSDCNWNVDPLMAYICGDYQPMILASSGCPDPESDVVDTLRAPEGLLTYTWYVATRGAVSDLNINNTNYMDTVPFRQIWPPEGGDATDNVYAVRLEDFVLTEGANAGDTASRQTFMCQMTSALNPERPFHSRIYANVNNRKPLVDHGHEVHCDRSVTFADASVVYSAEGQADDSTHWVFYADSLGLAPLDTVYGSVVTYTFPQRGWHSAKLFVTTAGDPCTAAEFFTFEVQETPPADFTSSTQRLCESDQLVLRASNEVRQYEGLTLQWAIDDSVIAETSADAHFYLPVGVHVVSLTTTSTQGCSNTTYDTVTVFGQPSIDLSTTVSAICLGDSVTLSAAGSVDYSWNSSPYDPSLDSVQGQNVFTVHPTVNTTYYLLPSTNNPCSIEGASVYIEVLPYPTPTINLSTPRVNMENSTVSVQDVSPYANTSQWVFSDGVTAEGSRVSHSFADLSSDSVSIALHTCNRLGCCSDTTIYLPVQNTTVWFPNTFIPEADKNNRFGIVTTLTLTSYEIYIYNRNGLLVYSSTDYTTPWDGMMNNGKPAPQGAYSWFCRYSHTTDATYTASGTVTLIR